MSSPSPTLQLAASSKETTQVPLAVALHLASLPSAAANAGLPIKLDWSSDAQAAGGAVLVAQHGGQKVSGIGAVTREIVNMYADTGIAGKDSNESKQVTTYIGTATGIAALQFADATKWADDLDQHLSLRTYLVGAGHLLTAADIAVWGAMRGASVFLGLLKKGTHIHLARWFDHVGKLPACASALEEIASAKFKEAKEVSFCPRHAKVAASFFCGTNADVLLDLGFSYVFTEQDSRPLPSSSVV